MKKRLKFPSKRGLTREELERYHRYAIDLNQVIIAQREYHDGVTVFGSRKLDEDNKYYIKARELGKKLAENGHIVITGGGPGIMEAANRGAYEAGGVSLGFNISIPTEQNVNSYVTESFEYLYFATRKLALVSSSKIWVFFPGGFGTLDELFEVLTLVRDGKAAKVPIFLVGSKFWKKLDSFFRSESHIDEEFDLSDTDLYQITDDIDEIVEVANKTLFVK